MIQEQMFGNKETGKVQADPPRGPSDSSGKRPKIGTARSQGLTRALVLRSMGMVVCSGLL